MGEIHSTLNCQKPSFTSLRPRPGSLYTLWIMDSDFIPQFYVHFLKWIAEMSSIYIREYIYMHICVYFCYPGSSWVYLSTAYTSMDLGFKSQHINGNFYRSRLPYLKLTYLNCEWLLFFLSVFCVLACNFFIVASINKIKSFCGFVSLLPWRLSLRICC